MPLRLKQKLRKALGKDRHPTPNPGHGESNLVEASSKHEPGRQNDNDTFTPQLDLDEAVIDNSLSAGIGQLALAEEERKHPKNNAVASGAAEVSGRYGVPLDTDERADSGRDIDGEFARSTPVAHVRDPYSEHVADRNILPTEKWSYSEDVDSETTQLPAAIQETRVVNTHEIVEQRITREVHNYDVVHRVLPVIDIEVLPPRHFVPSTKGDSLVEIPASQVPGGGCDDAPSKDR